MQILKGHTDRVRCLAYSPDGTMLASGGNDGILRLWDLATSEVRAEVACRQRQLNALAISPDGNLLATGGSSGAVAFWDSRTLGPLGKLAALAHPVRSLAFSPDGAALVSVAGADRALTGRYSVAVLWNVEDRSDRAILQSEHDAFRGVAFTPDGRQVVVGTTGSMVLFWDPFAVPDVAYRWEGLAGPGMLGAVPK